MTILIIYSALSTLAAVYCGWMAVKRWRERDAYEANGEYWRGRCEEVKKERDEWKASYEEKRGFLRVADAAVIDGIKQLRDLETKHMRRIEHLFGENLHATEWLNAANDRVRELERHEKWKPFYDFLEKMWELEESKS